MPSHGNPTRRWIALGLLGLPMGVHPKGRAHVDAVVVLGADGYRASFSRAELDPAFSDPSVLLADRRDGPPLGPEEGPWRLIVPSGRIRSRWVRQVKALELTRPR